MVKKVEEVKLELDHRDLPKLKGKWSWKNNSVDDVKILNLIQFLTVEERINFVNELYRVMKVGAKALIYTPHWCSSRAYGDLAFQYPPVAESWYFHLNAEWRKANAPWGTKYKCDFDPTWGYGMHPLIVTRPEEYQQNALVFYKEAAQDLIATITKK